MGVESVNILIVPLTAHKVLEFTDYLIDELREILRDAGIDNVDLVVWPEVVKPPMKCFSWERVQYHANCVARHLMEVFQVLGLTGKSFVIGVGCLDGYEHGLNFVFGEALPEYGVSVVFTKRLRPEFYGERVDFNLYSERLVKEVAHELGHLLRLGHCENYCVMRFSNSVFEVDEKPKYYCNSCKSKIRELYMSSTK